MGGDGGGCWRGEVAADLVAGWSVRQKKYDEFMRRKVEEK